MALVSATEMLQKAVEGHYAVGQFIINNLEWTKAILLTAQEVNSPVILGVSEGAGKYMGGYDVVVNMVKGLIKDQNITVPVALHLDHGSYDHCYKCLEAGLFPGAGDEFPEKSRPLGLVLEHLLRMELNGQDLIVLKALYDSVIRTGDNPHSLTGALDGLMVERIDIQTVLPEKTIERTAFFDGNPVTGSAAMDKAVGDLGRDILDQRASEGDIHQLLPPADCQDRFPRSEGRAGKKQVAPVPDRIDTDGLVPYFLSIQGRIEIRSAGKHNSVDPVDECLGRRLIRNGRENHRQTAPGQDGIGISRTQTVHAGICPAA